MCVCVCVSHRIKKAHIEWTAATFSQDLIRAAGSYLSLEARAKFNDRQHPSPNSNTHGRARERTGPLPDFARGRGLSQTSPPPPLPGNRHEESSSTGQYTGLSFFAPNINLYIHPLWGRGQETFGECPFLAGLLGGAYVDGIQGGSIADDSGFLRAIACAKHFVGYNFDSDFAAGGSNGDYRWYADVVITKADYFQSYSPHFRQLLLRGVGSVMCSYNRFIMYYFYYYYYHYDYYYNYHYY